MERTRRRGGQSTTILDWMKSNNEECELIKNGARNREDWHHWRPGLAFKQAEYGTQEVVSGSNDLNQTIYKFRFKSLRMTYDFDLNQFADGDFDLHEFLTISISD